MRDVEKQMKSKYASRSVEVEVGKNAIKFAKKYPPIVYDPFDFGKNPSPELYSRILKKRKRFVFNITISGRTKNVAVDISLPEDLQSAFLRELSP